MITLRPRAGTWREAQLPLVDQNIQVFTIEQVSSELEDHPCDPLTVDRGPPISVATKSMKELVKTKNKEGNEKFNFIVQYASYGSFTQEGVRIPSRFDTLRRVKREVQEEARWRWRWMARWSVRTFVGKREGDNHYPNHLPFPLRAYLFHSTNRSGYLP